MSTTDRVNIANAKLFGLAKDLDLGTGDKYNTALVIFFVPYCIFEVPSNMLLKKFKPHVWLSLNMFLFGFTTMMQGLVKNYSGLLATRFFLGLFETGMFPGGESRNSGCMVLHARRGSDCIVRRANKPRQPSI